MASRSLLAKIALRSPRSSNWPREFMAGSGVEIALDQPAGIGIEMSADGHRLMPAGDARPADGELGRAGDAGDRPVPESEQVLDRESRPALVIDPHQVGIQPRNAGDRPPRKARGLAPRRWASAAGSPAAAASSRPSTRRSSSV